jgi:hypothetical protein
MKYVYIALIALVLLEPAMMGVRKVFGRNNQTWEGGNGCNFVKYFGYKSPCCTPHDHAYKEGGWWVARWNSDVDLFKCVWHSGKLGKVMAPLMFVAARIIGPISFQYGPKREVPYPTPQ